MQSKLFGMTVGMASRGAVVSYGPTTRRSLETHCVCRWPLHLDRNCFLILPRNHGHLHIILDCDDSRDWIPTSLLDFARQSLRDWISEHQKSLFWSNKWNMIARTGARSFPLLNILQLRSILLVPRSGSNGNSLPLPFSAQTGLLPMKCGNLFLQQDDPLHLPLHLCLHLPHPLQDGSVKRLLIGLALLHSSNVVFTMMDLLHDPLKVTLDIPHVLCIVLEVNIQARLHTISLFFITKDMVQQPVRSG